MVSQQTCPINQSCDRRLARLISHIHHTSDYRQCCHVGNTAQHCRLGLFFKTQILLATLKTQNHPRVESFVFVEIEHLSPSVGCARSKRQHPTVLQKPKSFRWMVYCEWMDYLLSIYVWDVVTELLRQSNTQWQNRDR